MFRGNNPTRIDEKGRLKLPADFKRQIDEGYGTQFFITSRDGKRAELYPMKEWEKIEQAVLLLPASAAKKKFLEKTNYYGQELEMDAQGRLLIPLNLREAAALTGDVAVLGMQTYLAVVDDAKQVAAMNEDPLTEAEIESLGVVGL